MITMAIFCGEGCIAITYTPDLWFVPLKRIVVKEKFCEKSSHRRFFRIAAMNKLHPIARMTSEDGSGAGWVG